MSHIRQKIREHVAALIESLPSIAGRASVNRALPKPKTEALDAVVRVTGDEAEIVSLSGRQQRTVSLRVDLSAKGTDEQALTDALDAAGAEVETAIAGDYRLGGLSQTCEYRSSDFAIAGTGEKFAATLSIAFDAVVFTRREDPENPA